MQVRGTAMGTKFAPTYATLVLAYLEEMLYVQTEIKYGKEFARYIKNNWKRFLIPYLCFISLLYIDLCALGDDALIG